MKRTPILAVVLACATLSGCNTAPAPTTPTACTEALDNAAQLAEVTTQLEAKIDPAIESAYRQDSAALEALTSGLIPLREQVAELSTATTESITECDTTNG